MPQPATRRQTSAVVLKPCDVAITYNSSQEHASGDVDTHNSAHSTTLPPNAAAAHSSIDAGSTLESASSSTTLGVDSTVLALTLTPDTLKLILQVGVHCLSLPFVFACGSSSLHLTHCLLPSHVHQPVFSPPLLCILAASKFSGRATHRPPSQPASAAHRQV